MSDTSFRMREDPWRIFRIMSEFVDSFKTLSQVGPAVTIFGSARTKPSDKYYRAAHDIAKGLAQAQPRRRHRRRAGHHGGRQQGRGAGRRQIRRPQHRIAARTDRQPLRQRAAALPLFFCAQGLLREIQPRLHLHARRLRHARRIVRGRSRSCRPSASRNFRSSCSAANIGRGCCTG